MEPQPSAQPVDDGEGARRACDQCRLRKVRCDRRSPCANCATAKYYCSFTGNVQRSREHRQRMLVSSQYEKKIDDLESRLDKLTRLVERIAEPHNNRATTTPVPSRESSHAAVGDSLSATAVSPASPETREKAQDDRSGLFAALVEHATQRAGAGQRENAAVPLGLPDQSVAYSFHGNSSVTAHAAFAGQFVEAALTTSSSPGQTPASHPNMPVAVSSLQKLLRMQQQHSTVSEARLQHVQPLGPAGLAGLALPPLAAVVGVLRELRERQTVTFTLICAFDSIEAFSDKCKRVYFATEPFSTAVFISASAGLYYLFQEKAALAVQEAQEAARRGNSAASAAAIAAARANAATFRSYCLMCRDNLETAIASLSLLQPLCQETVEALIMAESYATEISKPSLAWQINAAACQAVVALGYHRKEALSGTTPDGAQQHHAVRFWIVYILDQALALRFGRSSILQDYDITLPRHIGPLNGVLQEHSKTIEGWLRHAEAQSRTYETLYSPVALLHPVEKRVRSARLCAELLLKEVQALAEARARLAGNGGVGGRHANAVDDDNDNDNDEGDDDGVSVAALLLKADDVSIRSTLTLVYRAVPAGSLDAPPGESSTFCTECIECARDVIQLHLECTQTLRRNMHLAPAYMHWTILFSPFIPFIVLFCHAIETCHAGDLQRIKSFKTSLEPFRSISEPVDRLYRLCEMLHDVAALYFEAQQSPYQYQQAYQQARQPPHQPHPPQRPLQRLQQQYAPAQQTQHLQQHGGVPSDDQKSHMGDAAMVGDVHPYLSNPGQRLAMDERVLSDASQLYPAGIESQVTEALNWYQDYVNMVGWSELSPSSWP